MRRLIKWIFGWRARRNRREMWKRAAEMVPAMREEFERSQQLPTPLMDMMVKRYHGIPCKKEIRKHPITGVHSLHITVSRRDALNFITVAKFTTPAEYDESMRAQLISCLEEEGMDSGASVITTDNSPGSLVFGQVITEQRAAQLKSEWYKLGCRYPKEKEDEGQRDRCDGPAVSETPSPDDTLANGPNANDILPT